MVEMGQMKQLPKRGSHKYLQIVGLLALAHNHAKYMRDIEVSICAIIDDKSEKPFGGGHVGDALYSWPLYEIDELLEKIAARRKTFK